MNLFLTNTSFLQNPRKQEKVGTMIEWVVLEEFPDYAINQFGQVCNLKTNRVLKPNVNQQGILKVGIRKEGQQYWRSVAILVAHNFLPEIPHGFLNRYPTVIHLDGNRGNVIADNLAWRTRSFARAYHKQFEERCYGRIFEPVRHRETGEEFEDSFLAAISFGLLEETVIRMVHRSESDWIRERESAWFERVNPKI